MTSTQWSQTDNQLIKTFEFEDFDTAFDFADEIREIANEMDHHPVLTITPSSVTVTLTTHDKGKVTELDQEMASIIDELYDEGFEDEDDMDEVEITEEIIVEEYTDEDEEEDEEEESKS